MKSLKYIYVALVLAATGCSTENEEKATAEVEAPVTVSVSPFSISQEEFPDSEEQTTRATVAEYTSMKAITLAFYKSDGTEQYKTTQFRSDATTYTTFGEFSTTLPLGNYTLVVIGYGQGSSTHAVTLTSPTTAAFDDYVRETFSATQAVEVNSKTPLNLTATLNRIMAKVSVISTDGRTAAANSVRVSFSGGSKSFNPTTGLATDNSGFSNTVVVNSVTAGNTTNVGNALFLTTDEQTMDITIETLDADDNVIYTATVPSVTLKRNRVTTLTGAMYSVTATATVGSFQINTDWLTGTDVGF